MRQITFLWICEGLYGVEKVLSLTALGFGVSQASGVRRVATRFELSPRTEGASRTGRAGVARARAQKSRHSSLTRQMHLGCGAGGKRWLDLLAQDEPVEDEHVETGSEEHPNSITRGADYGLEESIEGGVHKNGDARRGAKNVVKEPVRPKALSPSGIVCTRSVVAPFGSTWRNCSRSAIS